VYEKLRGWTETLERRTDEARFGRVGEAAQGALTRFPVAWRHLRNEALIKPPWPATLVSQVEAFSKPQDPAGSLSPCNRYQAYIIRETLAFAEVNRPFDERTDECLAI
jgi:hypothetical protein